MRLKMVLRLPMNLHPKKKNIKSSFIFCISKFFPGTFLFFLQFPQCKQYAQLSVHETTFCILFSILSPWLWLLLLKYNNITTIFLNMPETLFLNRKTTNMFLFWILKKKKLKTKILLKMKKKFVNLNKKREEEKKRKNICRVTLNWMKWEIIKTVAMVQKLKNLI